MKYLAKKFGSLFLTLLLVSFLSFFAFSVIPGDAAKSQLGTEATPGAGLRLCKRKWAWIGRFWNGMLRG